jgi:hypothetical protein
MRKLHISEKRLKKEIREILNGDKVVYLINERDNLIA